MNSLDLLQVGLLQRFYLTLRWYREFGFGPRKLGIGRWALDLGWLSIVCERYSV